MDTTKCPIWGTPATERSTSRDARDIISPRAGGRYLISRTAMVNMRSFGELEKSLLTTWIVDQHRSGETCPEIMSDILDSVCHRQRLSIRAKYDRLFDWLSRRLNVIGQAIPIFPSFLISTGSVAACRVDPKQADPLRHELCAWLECLEHFPIRLHRSRSLRQ